MEPGDVKDHHLHGHQHKQCLCQVLQFVRRNGEVEAQQKGGDQREGNGGEIGQPVEEMSAFQGYGHGNTFLSHASRQ